ncbi:atp-binding cassette transporter [Diplodia corticola]|uniref:Atp-binding cassette transporter n=1 Tax=Diplodia corticola TaxID=236234 RepID=A0A1J9RSA6_9PEZI|nr:atp-binding cassette transporter [Diplodia corticola]OJD30764.1 atp-binding cassette transporter [Diplodia corticola]
MNLNMDDEYIKVSKAGHLFHNLNGSGSGSALNLQKKVGSILMAPFRLNEYLDPVGQTLQMAAPSSKHIGPASIHSRPFTWKWISIGKSMVNVQSREARFIMTALTKMLWQAMALAGVLVLAIIICTGFTFPETESCMVDWFCCIWWTDPVYYSFEILIASEYRGRDFTFSDFVPSYPVLEGYQFIWLRPRCCSPREDGLWRCLHEIGGTDEFSMPSASQLYHSSAPSSIAAAYNTETTAAVVTLLFSMTFAFNGAMQPPAAALSGFWSFVYSVSPLTYWITGIVATELHERPVVWDRPTGSSHFQRIRNPAYELNLPPAPGELGGSTR